MAESGEADESCCKKGSLEAILPQISKEQRDSLHKKITLWLVRRGRPLSLCEHDTEFREIFDEIFRGAYVPPTTHLVYDNILTLSAEGKVKVMEDLKHLFAEGILPSIAGDIWSEGGIAIFGVLVYWMDADFKIQERLVGAIPFSGVRHTGLEVEKAAKTACADFGIGEFGISRGGEHDEEVVYKDTVRHFVHCTVSDNASNIVNGWKCFDGHECSCHTLALTVRAFLEHPKVKQVFVKLRGMTGHFNHSVLGAKVLNECQRRQGLGETKPPKDNDTRSGWGGACKQATWYMNNRSAVQLYDVEHTTKAATAVANLDGNVYKDHQLQVEEWDIVREAVCILQYAASTTDLLQGTSYPTANLVLPLVGKLFNIASDSTTLRYEGKKVEIQETAVQEARQKLCDDLSSRYFEDLMDCKLTKDKAVSWARHAWEKDWKPKQSGEPTATVQKKAKVNGGRAVVTVASFLADSDSDDEGGEEAIELIEVGEAEDELTRKRLAEGTIEHSIMAAMNA
ncbi:hypothetical protein CYMTET_14736 [Cymbomonas tetramitiformis]|uniref:Uncharacterized protein n=1 Tax=Cymbomonas tetramitiformis TaxID=36881 RepID=A0AAE0GFH8_9CHLO|nr:hypothetical protein CYMTET_14736 [Cymbomonas tetramitiformis]